MLHPARWPERSRASERVLDWLSITRYECAPNNHTVSPRSCTSLRLLIHFVIGHFSKSRTNSHTRSFPSSHITILVLNERRESLLNPDFTMNMIPDITFSETLDSWVLSEDMLRVSASLVQFATHVLCFRGWCPLFDLSRLAKRRITNQLCTWAVNGAFKSSRLKYLN